MLLFGPKNDVISKKKKIFTEILTVFPVGLSLLNVLWMGPLSSSWAPGSLSSPAPPLGGPDEEGYHFKCIGYGTEPIITASQQVLKNKIEQLKLIFLSPV